MKRSPMLNTSEQAASVHVIATDTDTGAHIKTCLRLRKFWQMFSAFRDRISDRMLLDDCSCIR